MLKQKTINGTDPATYDQECAAFLNEIGDNLKNIVYTSAALAVPVVEKGGIQQLNKPQIKTAISVINSCYIIYETPEEKQPILKPVQK